MKRITDERQEYEIYRLEHVALWTMFWLLVASIPVQLLLFHEPWMILGECVSVLVLSLFVLISFVKRGLWGNYTAPSWKSHVLSGLLTAVVGTSIVLACTRNDKEIVLYLFVSFIGLFSIAFLLSYALGVAVKKRENKLADENDDSLSD